jgi:hypothetical protein
VSGQRLVCGSGRGGGAVGWVRQRDSWVCRRCCDSVTAILSHARPLPLPRFTSTATTADEDNQALMDRAQERQRAFDDWADGVPKGAGVTKRV